MVGIVKAKELIMTGKMINAEEALKINLVNKIVPASELIGEGACPSHYRGVGPQGGRFSEKDDRS
jgi:1,4-dihydroxy-2-naphthoyl-CoA synthase